jgi:type VI secretion system secreted protein Hcp
MANGRWDTYLTVEGVTGESKRAGHEGQIDLMAFSFGGSNPSSVGRGGGGGTGTVSLQSFNVSKMTDASSAELFQAMCTGNHFPTAKITMYVSGGAAGAIQKVIFEFEEVYIELIQWSGSEGDASVIPHESVTFAFGKVTITYNEQNPDGTVGGAHVGTWDVRTGTSA